MTLPVAAAPGRPGPGGRLADRRRRRRGARAGRRAGADAGPGSRAGGGRRPAARPPVGRTSTRRTPFGLPALARLPAHGPARPPAAGAAARRAPGRPGPGRSGSPAWPATRRPGWAWPGRSSRSAPGDVRGLGPVVRAIAVPGLIALAVMAPWLVRNWLVFGSPLPGQAITNAWAITGFEIFAWQDPADRGRATSPWDRPTWLEHRVDGFAAQPARRPAGAGRARSPSSGSLALPWAARLRALRPLLVLALITFLVATLVFPVQTRWGTFLHASVPAAVLLLVAGLAGLDEGLAWVGRRRGWTRPVAWLAPLFAGRRRPPLHGAGRHRLRRPGPGHGGRVRGPGAPDGGGRRPPRRSGPRHRQPPDLGRGGAPRLRPGPARRAGRERGGPRPHVRGADRRSSTATTAAGPTAWPPTRTRPAWSRSPCRPRRTRLPAATTFRVFRVACP